jgi:hypothetical protein
MNKISPLDIRVAVLAHPLVSREESESAVNLTKPVYAYMGDERIVSLFQNSPKPRTQLDGSNVPLILRKVRLAVLRAIAVIGDWLKPKEQSKVLEEVSPPRRLYVPRLPHPPFQTTKPARFFWHPAYIAPKDEYAPSCLISEAKEEGASVVFNSSEICNYASHALSKKGILRQDHQGFVYLELPDDFITHISPLIQDRGSEAVPLYCLEPSPAHIPVILPHEWAQKKGWGELKGLEESFPFEIMRLCSLKPKAWPGVEKVYFFEIESKALEEVRERSLLPPLIRSHKFHVAIAFKKAMEKPAVETFRLNVSCFAA